jgi:hypothetical protein
VSERLFTIEDGGADFRAGACPDGTQALFGLWHGRVVACFFAPDGRFLRFEQRPTRTPCSPAGPARVARRWWREVGFRPGRIAVREFACPTEGLGVHDGLGQFDEDQFDPDELAEPGFREGLAADRAAWAAAGRFLLLWDRDYEMSAEGHVLST